MKNIAFLITGFMAISVLQLSAQTTDGETLKEFLKGITAFDNEKTSSLTTIQSINAIAAQKAEKTISITPDNIIDALKDARQYKHCLVIVGEYTIVKVVDFENCSHSGSWGTCMPYGEGFIRKGGFVSIKDYINNIIGKPDTQERKMYLFN
jgi:hypothetical protein